MQTVSVTKDLRAPIGRLWDLLLDVERFADYMSDVEWIKVLDVRDDVRTAEWSVILRGSILRWSEKGRIDPSRHRIDFEQADGDLSVFRGEWLLTELGAGRTRASLRIEFEIGIPLMARMLDPIARESLRTNTGRMLEELEQRACAPEE
jgi:ribosome-associated toxin RatA of RatAB toxin-antitoxin module